VLGLHKGLQVGEVHLPENPVIVEPGIDDAERLGVQLVQAAPARAAFAHEAGAAQQAQVLGNGRSRNGEGFGDLSGGEAARSQKVQDRAAGGVGERAEGRGR